MQACNVPTILAAGEDLPPPTWEVLWDTIKPHPASVATALAKTHGSCSWEGALKVTVDAAKDATSLAADLKRRVGTFADSPAALYFLVVSDGKVQVLYGWRTCRALDNDGKTWAGLMGDRRISASGVELPPKLFCLAGDAANQYKWFGKVTARPPTMANVQAGLGAAGAPALLDPAPADAEGVEAVSVWGVLPVHPKVASLFMHSPTVKEAIGLFVILYQVVPDEAKGGLDPLASFLRVSVVDVDDEEESALEGDWHRVNVHDSDELELWHAEACGAYAPKFSEAVPPPDRPRLEQPTEGVKEFLSTIGAGAHTKEPGKRAYTSAELRRLSSLCGLSRVDPEDLTTEQLPRFWRGFESVRGKLHSARAYVEAWFNAEWPPNAPRYQRFVSTRLLKDLISLDFDGGDEFLSWTEREGGFSLFSVYPLPDGSDPGARRRRAVAFEDTMDNHRPSERQSMAEASAFEATIPTGRTTTWEWIMYVQTATECIFGRNCPALDSLERYVEYLNEGIRFKNFTETDWRTLFWKLHVALRGFFSPTRRMNMPATQGLRDFLMVVRMGLMPNHSELPSELLGRGQPLRPEGNRRDTIPQLETGIARDQPSPANEANGLAKRVAKEWQSLLARPLKDAKDALLAANKTWGMKVVFPNGAKEAFGGFASQVKATGSGNTTPCPRLFAYGKCASRRCNCSHNLLREPSAGESRAYIDWVQRRCGEIKRNPGNF